MICCSNTLIGTTSRTKVVGTTKEEIVVPAIIVGTVVPTIILVIYILTRVDGTAAK